MSEQRFQHLLQPIRDLANNWNIDIANDLEGYLEELESISISFDEGSTSFNFAEAALVIQGTACIYSRKVEHLYSLVYQTLEHLSNQKTQKSSVAKTNSKDDPLDMFDYEDDGDEIGDILPICNSLKEANQNSIYLTASQNSNKKKKLSLMNGKANGTNYQASVALMGSLVPDELDSGDHFKLMTCTIHSSGALLIEESCKELLDPHADISMSVQITNHEEKSNYDIDGDDDMDNKDIEDNDFGYEDPVDDDDNQNETTLPTAYKNTPLLDEELSDSNHKPTNNETNRKQNSASEKAEVDPWKPLDPYDISSSVNCPFRKGRTFSTISAKQKNQVMNLSTSTLPSSHTLLCIFDIKEKIGMRGISMKKSYSYIYERELKRLARLQKKTKNQQNIAQLKTQYNTFSTQSSSTYPTIEDDMDDSGYDINDEYLSDASEYNDISMEDNSRDSTLEPLKLSTLFDQESSQPTYEELCRAHIDAFMQGTEQYMKETNLSKQVEIWQGKLAPLLREQEKHPIFDIHVCGDEIVSQLEKASKVLPMENPVENREENSNDIFSKDDSSVIPFADVVEGKQPYEICRLFLASLQLANNGNVKLSHGQSASEQEQVPFSLHLLTTDDCYESLR